jgi:hypothetical protein
MLIDVIKIYILFSQLAYCTRLNPFENNYPASPAGVFVPPAPPPPHQTNRERGQSASPLAWDSMNVKQIVPDMCPGVLCKRGPGGQTS